jgi:hypothetical protein
MPPLKDHEVFQDFQDPDDLKNLRPEKADESKCPRCGTPESEQPGTIIVAMQPVPCPICGREPQ